MENVAISPEAKSAFQRRLGDSDAFDKKMLFADFEITRRDFGEFSFTPNKNEKYRRTLSEAERFSVGIRNGFARDALNDMTPAENGRLKELDLTEPVDENIFLEEYYRQKREKGEELGCDTDTIRKTPLRYMTDEQAALIRNQYRAECDGYSADDWHYHGDFIYDKIITELAEKFRKTYCGIQKILELEK